MLLLGFCALSLAIGLGACLVAGRLRRGAVVHGLAGLTGLGMLVLALRSGLFGGPFALDAVVLAGAAASGGAALYALKRARRPRPNLLVALHAMAGGVAYLLLAGFVFGR